MADIQTPADIAASYFDDAETQRALEQDITDWYNNQIEGIKAAFHDVISTMETLEEEALIDAIDDLEIYIDDES